MGPSSIAPREDRSGTIESATYSLTGVLIAFFIARQVMKAIVFRKFALDDFFIIISTTFAMGLSVTTLILTSKDFGVLDYLSVDRANSIMKAYYASELLYISSLCFSKLSILVLFYNVVVIRKHRFFVTGFGMSIFAWIVASVTAIAFQCELPRPWEMMTLRCFNARIFWLVYCAIDTSTELFIVMLSVDLVAHLKVRMSRKFAVVACFAPRLVVVTAAIARAIYLYRISPHGNPEFDLWTATICTQAHVCTSVCTACIPYMVPFFKSLQGNVWRSYSTRSWTTKPKISHTPGPSPKRLRKREAAIRFESPQSFTSLIREPERVSMVSPRIPSPAPISPFMPPPIAALRLPQMSSNAADTMEIRDLGVSGGKYRRDSDEAFDIVSLQSAMCFSQSPIVAPAQARLSSVAIVNMPEHPAYSALIDSPNPSNSSSCYSSRASTPTRSASTPRFSLFPQTSRQHVPLQTALPHDSILMQGLGQMQPSAASNNERRLTERRTLPSPPLSHEFDDYAHPARSASSRSHPKFSTTPRLHALPSGAVPKDCSYKTAPLGSPSALAL